MKHTCTAETCASEPDHGSMQPGFNILHNLGQISHHQWFHHIMDGFGRVLGFQIKLNKLHMLPGPQKNMPLQHTRLQSRLTNPEPHGLSQKLHLRAAIHPHQHVCHDGSALASFLNQILALEMFTGPCTDSTQHLIKELACSRGGGLTSLPLLARSTQQAHDELRKKCSKILHVSLTFKAWMPCTYS